MDEIELVLPMLHPGQQAVMEGARRFNAVTCGRRWGKTDLGIDLAVEGVAQGWPVGWFAPTYKLLADAWRHVEYYTAPLQAPNGVAKSERRIVYITGGEIEFWTLESPDAGRSRKYKRVILDEAAMVGELETAWNGAIRPTLADLGGDAWFFTTPRGFDYYYQLTQLAETKPDLWSHSRQPTSNNPYIEADELQSMRVTMDPRHYAQEVEASFEQLANRVYFQFHYVDNVRVVDDRKGPLLVGIDFNVDPMSAVIAQQAADELEVLDELQLRNSNTEELCIALRQRYPNRSISVFPDPSGSSRKTSAAVGVTDFAVLRRFGFHLLAPNQAPPVVDRVNEVNALACNVEGRRRLWVHPRCRALITAMNQLVYKDKTSLIDKAHGFDHITDALGYLIHVLFPLVYRGATHAQIKWG